MSGNLIEFIKVFALVFTFSSLILAGRRFMLKLDDDAEDEDNIVNFPNQSGKTDTMDYDGMGNYGRFPKKLKRKK